MKSLLILAFVLIFANCVRAQYAAQDELCISATSAPGVYTLTYPSVAGRVYFLQVSTDLDTWNYCPVVQLGDGSVKPWLLCSDGTRVFARLEYSLATTFTAGDSGDVDGDGLSNLAEITTHLTQPGNDDSDGDGLTDGAEVTSGLTDPLSFDLPEITVVSAWRKSSITDALRRPGTNTSIWTRAATASGTGNGTAAGLKNNVYTWPSLPAPNNTASGFPLTTATAAAENWTQGRSPSNYNLSVPIAAPSPPVAGVQENEIPAAWRLERLHGTSLDFIATTNPNVEQFRNIDALSTLLERTVRLQASRPMPKSWRVYYKAHNATQYGRGAIWTVAPGTLTYFEISPGQTQSSTLTLSVAAASTLTLPVRSRTSSAAPWVNSQVYETRAIKWVEFTGRPAQPTTGDADGDGIPDATESHMGLSSSELDSNGDGLSDGDALIPNLFRPKTEAFGEREVEYAYLPDDPKCPSHPARRIEVRPLNAGITGVDDPMATATGIGSALQSKIDALGAFPAAPPAINIPCIPAASDTAVLDNGLTATMYYSKASSGPPTESSAGTQKRVWARMEPAPDAAATKSYVKLTEVTNNGTTTASVSVVTFNFAKDATTSNNFVHLNSPVPASVTATPGATVKQSAAPVEVLQPAIRADSSAGELEKVQQLRFCRWNSPHVDPGGDLVNTTQFPAEDPDRIVVRVPLPHLAGQGGQLIKVSTGGSTGARNDAGADVDLIEVAGKPGIFESKPIALVADQDDDVWAGGRAADGALNDPTFRSWPGGILKIQVPALQNAVIEFPVKKFTHYFTCSRVHAGNVYADPDSVTAMNENMTRLPELYAPIHERVDFTDVDPEAGVPTISTAELQAIAGADNKLDDAEIPALIAKIDALGLPAGSIKIVFIDKTIILDVDDNKNGTNLMDFGPVNARRSDIVLCWLVNLRKLPDKRWRTVAHECGHGLRGAGHVEAGGIYEPGDAPFAPLLPKWHLMSAGNYTNGLGEPPPRAGKHWYVRDAKIVNEGAGNRYSKKIP